MRNSTAAYDFSMFEERKKQQKPQIREITNNKAKSKKRSRVSPAKATFVCLMLVSMFSLFIYSHVALNESKGDVMTMTKKLDKLESENQLLDVELEKLLSIGNIDQYATNELGLCKREQYQIQYIQTGDENKITVTEKKGDLNVIDEVKRFFNSIIN